MTHENVVETHNLFYSAVCIFHGGGLGAVASHAELDSDSLSSAVSSLGSTRSSLCPVKQASLK